MLIAHGRVTFTLYALCSRINFPFYMNIEELREITIVKFFDV